MPAILGHDLLDGVPSMIERLSFTVADDCVGVGSEMHVFMQPYVNVVLNGCAL